MKRIPKGYGLPREDLLKVIEQLADRLANQDRSFELQALIQTGSEALIELHHIEGLKLLNRISLMLLTDNGKDQRHHEYVLQRVRKMQPLDRVTDSAALRSLAESLRAN